MDNRTQLGVMAWIAFILLGIVAFALHWMVGCLYAAFVMLGMAWANLPESGGERNVTE